ncbi:DUF2953 domain-containing protein [Thermoactinomyces sp. DSM 45892]|uniref:DUF2953 domain-containing protein n=1 Tax=Thermoactinomyces sp. DSM 45892 TaxID=1882753 RepID=UPI00089ABCC5|nr:DUF2953 domain-containing protein [Thermoactinomyces sp. DSM 45892]SDZ09130.1 Protein of unknown function [Thermoactinomyces sp. DSM 45892]
MQILSWVFLILFIVLILIVCSNIQIELEYQREGKMDDGAVRIKVFYGLIRYTMRISEMNMDVDPEKGITYQSDWDANAGNSTVHSGKSKERMNWSGFQNARERFSEILERVQDFFPLIRYFCSKICCKNLEWKTQVGTGDAAEAGVLTGLVWGIKSFLISAVGNYIKWKKAPEIDVIPHFNQLAFNMYFHCILCFRVWHAIVVVTRLWIQMRKGRERTWQASTQFKA